MYISDKKDIDLEDLDYDMCILNDRHWDNSEFIIPTKCRHCRTIYNFMDFSDGICPFCDR